MRPEPSTLDPELSEEPEEFEEPPNHVLDVYLIDNRPVDVRLDGESLFPVWFKLEFKETGEVSAKVKGVRLATRLGDVINIHNGAPVAQLQTSGTE